MSKKIGKYKVGKHEANKYSADGDVIAGSITFGAGGGLFKPNSLVTDTTGTWLSNNARNALLYGSLVEAYIFMKGEADLLQQYEQRFGNEINRLKNLAEARGRRDEYRYDSLRTNVT